MRRLHKVLVCVEPVAKTDDDSRAQRATCGLCVSGQTDMSYEVEQ